MALAGDPLTPDQIAAYRRDGVLVVDSVLSPDELAEARRGLANTLMDEFGVDVHNLPETGRGLVEASSTNGAGGVLDVFYPEWKLKVATNAKLFAMTRQLWRKAYFHGDGEGLSDDVTFEWHPFGPFDSNKGYMYIDRIGYRIPTELAESIGRQLESEQRDESNDEHQSTGQIAPNIAKKTKKKKRRGRPIQRSLTPHLDCCPETFHDATSKTKWRPIQCFVSLTDNLEPNTGGFEAAKGFHREFQRWAREGRRPINSSNDDAETSHPRPCVGDYTHISPSHDRDLLDRMEHVPVKAGSAVFWDNRIPHANAYRNDACTDGTIDAGALGTSGARAVVYCSFLPDVEINREFVRRQLEDWRARRPPRVGDRWIEQGEQQPVENLPDAEEGDSLSELGKKLIGLVEWT